MPSIYLPELERLKPGDETRLEGPEFHHLAHVARRRAEDALALNSGQGSLGTGIVLKTAKDHALLRVTDIRRCEPFPAPYAIAFALLKNRHDELLVEKCTELGASAFFPMLTEYSVRQAGGNTLERFRKTALAAIKQCDNPWLPEVLALSDLSEALGLIEEKGFTPVVCSERHPELWLHHIPRVKLARPCFLIGAEGGWSDAEFKALERFQHISLGNLITRAETAAIAVAAQWLAYAEQCFSVE